MQFPIIKTKHEKQIYTDVFGGINRTPDFSVSEFSDMKNLSSDNFPNIMQSAKKDAVQINTSISKISSAISPGQHISELAGFTGVANKMFYYQDKYIPLAYSFMELTDNSEVLDFGGKIIISPQMYVYEYLNENKKDKVYPLASGCYEQEYAYVTSEDTGARLLTVNINSRSDSTWEKYGFSVGDSVIIKVTNERYKGIEVLPLESRFEECRDKWRIVSAVVEGISGKAMTIHMYNYKGEDTTVYMIDEYGNEKLFNVDYTESKEGDIWVYKYIPPMDNVCVHKNRLWGTAATGEVIYASAPGSPESFFELDGLSTDSWYTEIESNGKFTGIKPFGGNIIAFKKDSIYHIYGDRASNFNIPKVIYNCGCIDKKTICQTDTAIYFMAHDGVYEYSGGTPRNISKNLGISKYISGGAFSDGKKYYFSPNGENVVYAYDRQRGLWHVEAEFNLICGFKFNNEVYFVSKNKVYKNSESFDVSWEATFCDITENVFEHKGINNLYLRIKNGEGSYAEVLTASGDDEFSLSGRTDEPGEYTFRIPVRFKKGDRYRIKIRGFGSTQIIAMERVLYAGGRAITRKG